jgi:hypothetical protein
MRPCTPEVISGMPRSTGFRMTLPELPARMTDSQASKSSTKSVCRPALTSMADCSFSPLCCALGVARPVSAAPVGLTALASGLAGEFSASTSRSSV